MPEQMSLSTTSRSVSKTGEQLALEMADALLNVFGSAKPSDDDRRELADFITREGLRWVDDRWKVLNGR